jgi:hypothetical protein
MTANRAIAHSGPISHAWLIIESNGPFTINALILRHVRFAQLVVLARHPDPLPSW